MAEERTVVSTGASRGLGLASAVRLYNDGRRVGAAMRSSVQGSALLRDATGAGNDVGRLVPRPALPRDGAPQRTKPQLLKLRVLGNLHPPLMTRVIAWLAPNRSSSPGAETDQDNMRNGQKDRDS